MKRHELMDLIQEIQDRNYNKFVGTNEAELATREEICDLWEEEFKKVNLAHVISWVTTSEQVPEFGVTVLVYCKIYGKFLATFEYIGEFAGDKYGNWRDFNGNIGILPPVYWMEIPKPPCA